jgi:hypothetical protein
MVAATECAQAQRFQAWKVGLRVIDDEGQPITNAQAWVAYGIPLSAQKTNDWDKIEGLTDEHGVFKAEHRDTGSYSLGIHIRKIGFYPTDHVYDLGPSYTPEIWNVNLTMVLKKIGQPIPMYAKREETKIPKEDEPVGFDLIVGDWIAPYGAGKSADVLFTVHRKITNPQEFDASLGLTFPKIGDGVVVVPPVPATDSPLVMPRTASVTGYQSALTWSYHNFTENSEPASGYFFRVRTALDSNGNIQSALYGKIQGDVRFYVGTKAPRAGIGFQYYLNPTPNDRNVEFDPKRNLFGGLQSFEQVTGLASKKWTVKSVYFV